MGVITREQSSCFAMAATKFTEFNLAYRERVLKDFVFVAMAFRAQNQMLTEKRSLKIACSQSSYRQLCHHHRHHRCTSPIPSVLLCKPSQFIKPYRP